MNYALVKSVIKLSNYSFMKAMMKRAVIHIILALFQGAKQFIMINKVKKGGKNSKAIMKILKKDIENNLKIALMMIGSRQIAYNV